MDHPNAFALQTSDLNAFLFADVGTELNGSPLTILSMLARLGRDPWADAARLAKLPKNEAFDYLTRSISEMPLGPESAAGTPATVSRLLLLLPGQTQTAVQSTSGTVGVSALPQWVPIALLCASLVIGMVLNMIPAVVPGAAAPAPAAHTVAPATPIQPLGR